MAERVCVARIGAPHGVRGEVRLWVFTEDPRKIRAYGPFQSEDGRTFEIASLRQAKDHFVARLKGVDDRNAAETLTNVELYIPRDRLPPAEDDTTFYHADLIGLAAVNRDGDTLGTVIGVHNFGAGDLLEIRPRRGQSVLVPFTAAHVPEIDIAGRRAVVDSASSFDPVGEKPADEPD